MKKTKQLLGYKDNSPFRNEPFIDIDSNRITMKGVSIPIVAYPDNDKPIVMTPGKEYLFPNSTKVKEVPYQVGGINNETPVTPILNLKMYKNAYKLPGELKTTLQYGGILDQYLKTIPKDQQESFLQDFQNLDEEVKQEVVKFMYGGAQQIYQKGAEVEGGESAVLPNSELVKFEGDKHKDGGIKVSLPSGTRIYSEYLTAPKEVVSQVLGTETNKEMSYADLSKKFPTKPYMDTLKESADEYIKRSAQLKLMHNLGKLDTIFFAQEQEKKQGKGFQSGGTFGGGQFGGSGAGYDWTTGVPTQTEFELPPTTLKWKATDKNRPVDPFTHSDDNPVVPLIGSYSRKFIPLKNDFDGGQFGGAGAGYDIDDTSKKLYENKNSQPSSTVRNQQPVNSSKPKPKPVVTLDNEISKPLPFGQLPTTDVTTRQVISMAPKEREDEGIVYNVQGGPDDKSYSPPENKFGISPKLAGTIADIGLALSDKLNVSGPILYDRRKYPLFTRFVDFDDKEAGRMFNQNIDQIQKSNLPEQVKQAQISELLGKYKDYQAKVDFNNLQRYEQKREADTNKLQQYLDMNTDIKISDLDNYRQRKARVDQLRDAFYAQRKSRIVNSLKAYADYADKINMANQLGADNYQINPVTGRINFKETGKSNLTQDILNQYAKNNRNKIDLGNGVSLNMLSEETGVVVDANGKAEIIKIR